MAISLRPATRADIDLLEAWGRDLHEVERKFEPVMRYEGEAFRERDIGRLESPDAYYLIAELGGRPVGYITATLEAMPEHLALSGREFVIEALFVEAAARGQGVGAALLGACLDWAKVKGATRVQAGIYFKNEASLALFKRFGLEPHHLTVVGTLE